MMTRPIEFSAEVRELYWLVSRGRDAPLSSRRISIAVRCGCWRKIRALTSIRSCSTQSPTSLAQQKRAVG
jgi:hypothetical protein